MVVTRVVALKDPTCTKRPNFVLIMSDDQDKYLGSLNYQPAVQKNFIEQGTAFEKAFEKHFCTQSQCCPSRVSCLTGKHGHNTNVTDVLPPFGGYPKFVSEGLNDHYLPPGEYSTDLVSQKSLDFLDEASESSRPFFFFEPPVAAERHKHLYPDAKIPRTKSFNPPVVSPPLSLMFTSTLESHNLLDDTYVIYTSDNGFHIGQHRLQPGKTNCYEEDVNVPFFIRGPGVARGAAVHHPTLHIDLTPTIFDLAGIPQRADFESVPMPVSTNSKPLEYESVNIEFWSRKTSEKYLATLLTNFTVDLRKNTYKSVRIVGPGYNLMYSVWCTNDHELLKGLMMVLKSCKGQECIYPWKTIHPDGDVTSLREAMKPRFDCFYEEEMPEVHFDSCEVGYLVEAEGPQIQASFRV
ncbi:alkaline-phosphatase-like protein [Coniochaeta sp. 2T2.1]|nr:alkaline-phosphatase-like protein [Coniochaeta sp. 2T2.1]